MVKYWSDRVKILNLYNLQSILDFTPALVNSCYVTGQTGECGYGLKTEDALTVVLVPDSFVVHISHFCNHPNRR